jgi:hypothetical protein
MTFQTHQTTWVVYEKDSTKRIDNLPGGPDKTHFGSPGAAKAARTRFLKAQTKYKLADIEIAPSSEFYSKIEKKILHKGIAPGTGKYIEIELTANTPWSCNPLSETYWSS